MEVSLDLLPAQCTTLLSKNDILLFFKALFVFFHVYCILGILVSAN